jgi:hypothetical protein
VLGYAQCRELLVRVLVDGTSPMGAVVRNFVLVKKLTTASVAQPNCMDNHMKTIYNAYIEISAQNRAQERDILNIARGLANRVGGFKALAAQSDRRLQSGRPLRFRFCSEVKRKAFLRKLHRYVGAWIRVNRLTCHSLS